MLDLDDIDTLTLSNYYAPALPSHKYSRVSSSGPKEHSQAIKNGSQYRKKERRIAFPASRIRAAVGDRRESDDRWLSMTDEVLRQFPPRGGCPRELLSFPREDSALYFRKMRQTLAHLNIFIILSPETKTERSSEPLDWQPTLDERSPRTSRRRQRETRR